MSPAGKGGRLSPFLLPFLFLPCHGHSPSSSWLGILPAILSSSPLGVTEDAGAFFEGLTPCSRLLASQLDTLIGMTQMAVVEENTQE